MAEATMPRCTAGAEPLPRRLPSRGSPGQAQQPGGTQQPGPSPTARVDPTTRAPAQQPGGTRLPGGELPAVAERVLGPGEPRGEEQGWGWC